MKSLHFCQVFGIILMNDLKLALNNFSILFSVSCTKKEEMPNQVSHPHQHTMVSSKISKVSLGFPGKVNAFAFNKCNKCVWNEQN